MTVTRGLEWWRDVPGGTEWLDALPAIVETCAERWSLLVGPAFDGQNVSHVRAAELPDGTPAVLKINFPSRSRSTRQPRSGCGTAAGRDAARRRRARAGALARTLPPRDAALGDRGRRGGNAPRGRRAAPDLASAARGAPLPKPARGGGFVGRKLPEDWEALGGPIERRLTRRSGRGVLGARLGRRRRGRSPPGLPRRKRASRRARAVARDRPEAARRRARIRRGVPPPRPALAARTRRRRRPDPSPPRPADRRARCRPRANAALGDRARTGLGLQRQQGRGRHGRRARGCWWQLPSPRDYDHALRGRRELSSSGRSSSPRRPRHDAPEPDRGRGRRRARRGRRRGRDTRRRARPHAELRRARRGGRPCPRRNPLRHARAVCAPGMDAAVRRRRARSGDRASRHRASRPEPEDRRRRRRDVCARPGSRSSSRTRLACAPQQIEAWRTWTTHARPFVTYKVAVTLDGRVTVPGARWVSAKKLTPPRA